MPFFYGREGGIRLLRLAELAYVGFPRKLSAGLRLTAFSSLLARRLLASNPFFLASNDCIMVGKAGFEPATSWSRTKRASQAALLPDKFPYQYIITKSKRQLISVVQKALPRSIVRSMPEANRFSAPSKDFGNASPALSAERDGQVATNLLASGMLLMYRGPI